MGCLRAGPLCLDSTWCVRFYLLDGKKERYLRLSIDLGARMSWRLRSAVVLLTFLGTSLLASCTPAGACGVFDFEGTLDDTSTENALPMSLDFDFNPDACGSAATCDTVAWVQMVRNFDFEDLTNLFPSSEKEDRATTDGWYIDRLEDRVWGYYGRNNNGTFAGNVTTGSDTTTATLFDRPKRGDQEPWLDFWWMAVSVPVCLDEDSAVVNNLLGYYFWSWTADESGVMGGPFDALAWESLDVSFGAAVDGWDADAPGLGKNEFPNFVDLT